MIEAVIAADPVIATLQRNWVKREEKRTARHKEHLERLVAEYNDIANQYRALRKKMSTLRAAMDMARQHARIKPKPNSTVRCAIGRRRQFIQRRELKAFLRQQRITFGQLTKQIGKL